QGHRCRGSSSEIDELHVHTIFTKYPRFFGHPGWKLACGDCAVTHSHFSKLSRDDGEGKRQKQANYYKHCLHWILLYRIQIPRRVLSRSVVLRTDSAEGPKI